MTGTGRYSKHSLDESGRFVFVVTETGDFIKSTNGYIPFSIESVGLCSLDICPSVTYVCDCVCMTHAPITVNGFISAETDCVVSVATKYKLIADFLLSAEVNAATFYISSEITSFSIKDC